jgi:cell division initiation protein
LKLTPLDIKKQEFKKAIRGYDAIEVETFLEMVAEEFEAVIREKNSLQDEALKLKTQLRDYQNVEKALQDTLMTAQQSIAESRQNSQRQADLIVREAEIKAEKILEDAKFKLAELKNELVLVKSQKESFARRLRHLLTSQMDLIDVLESDDMGYGKFEEKRGAAANSSSSNSATENQEKIEFESIEDMLSKRTTAKSEASPAINPGANPPKSWTQQPPENSEEQTNELQEKRSRISDQLIF